MPKTIEKPEASAAEPESLTSEHAHAATDEFKVLYEHVIARERDGMIPPIIVDVARIPGHGLIARQQLSPPFGSATRLWLWDEKLRTIGQRLQTFDGQDTLMNQLNVLSGNLKNHHPSPLINEVLAEMKRVPALSEALNLARFLPRPAFDAGYIQVQHQASRGPQYPTIGWHEFMDRHTGGDFGNYGTLEPDHQFTAAETFALELCPIHIQNLHAIRTRTGSIRSEFKTAKGQTVYVLTVHMSDRAEGIRTVAWIAPG